MASLSPERIDLIRKMEEETTAAAMKRMDARLAAGDLTEEEKEDLEEYLPRTFFHGKLSRKGSLFPIDTIVEWSKTARGGRQFELLDTSPEGCTRWGLCESNKEK